jgi:hypothetical protein
MLWRPDGGGNVARRLPGGAQFQTRCGNWLAGEGDAGQAAIDVPQRVQPRHGLLPQVTTLREADRQAVAADLLRQVLVRDVATEFRRARLDAEDVQHRAPARVRSGLAQRRADLRRVVRQALDEERRGRGPIDAAHRGGATGQGTGRVAQTLGRRLRDARLT